MIALINYGAGNVASVANALNDLDVEYKITNKEMDICNADKIIFPGVGEASYAIQKLHMMNLFTLLRIVKKPLLGICLGAHLLCEKSEEGDVSCLGHFPVTVKKFEGDIKIPHMGWNKVKVEKENPLFEGIPEGEQFYFAHSYYMPENDYSIASCEYGEKFSVAIKKDNFYGVQFHPEKSGKYGVQLLRNFVEKC